MLDDIAWAACLPSLLIVTDFDGTLSTLAARPTESMPCQGAVSVLENLARISQTRVVVLSGRGRSSLIDVLGMPKGVELMGSYGLEHARSRAKPSVREGKTLAAIRRRFTRIAAEYSVGVASHMVEVKPFSIVLHTRGLPKRQRAIATARALAACDDLAEIHVECGKCTVEAGCRLLSKTKSVERLLGRHTVSGIWCAGDDAADEALFAFLHRSSDLPGHPRVCTIKVGRGQTMAKHRVAHPRAWISALSRLATARQQMQRGGYPLTA